MGVTRYGVYFYSCTCEKCDKRVDIQEDKEKGIYNGAQAVRALGWSFGKDKRVLCDKCRLDNYQYAGWYKEKHSGHK